VISKEPRVNERIRVREVRLVDPDGGQVGIKSIEEARWLADQLGLDLVEVAPDARPPVVRLMDYGKFKYEASVKAREARKRQTRTVIKEVQFRPKIASSDFEVKRKRVERFLREGDKVKVTMRFRGREVTHPELGRNILVRLAEAVEEFGTVETMPRLEGRQMTMVLAGIRQQKPARRSEAEESAPEATEETIVEETSNDATDEAASEQPAPTAVVDVNESENEDGAEAASEQPATEQENDSAEAEDA
jgi:translation initiation factor IF-3